MRGAFQRVTVDERLVANAAGELDDFLLRGRKLGARLLTIVAAGHRPFAVVGHARVEALVERGQPLLDVIELDGFFGRGVLLKRVEHLVDHRLGKHDVIGGRQLANLFEDLLFDLVIDVGRVERFLIGQLQKLEIVGLHHRVDVPLAKNVTRQRQVGGQQRAADVAGHDRGVALIGDLHDAAGDLDVPGQRVWLASEHGQVVEHLLILDVRERAALADRLPAKPQVGAAAAGCNDRQQHEDPHASPSLHGARRPAQETRPRSWHRR